MYTQHETELLKKLKATLMKKTDKKNSNSMFPIEYNGKLWYEKDCNDVFLAFYNDFYSLNHDCSVYMMAGDYVFPDGKMKIDGEDVFLDL